MAKPFKTLLDKMSPERKARIEARVRHMLLDTCRACANLRRVTNGNWPDRPCPFCRSKFSQCFYYFKLQLWKWGWVSTRSFR